MSPSADLSALPDPEAVIFDVGGVFLLPDPDVIGATLARHGVVVDARALDRAHYHGAAAMPVGQPAGQPFVERWESYLAAYVGALGVEDDVSEVSDAVASAFSSMAAWNRPAPGARDALARVVGTGIPVGIVSNADGTVAQILRTHEIMQVGPGPGVDVRCIIDSGEVGVDKPDPRIFRIALDALDVAAERSWYVGDTPAIDIVGARDAGLSPILLDPEGLHADADFARATSVGVVADELDRRVG